MIPLEYITRWTMTCDALGERLQPSTSLVYGGRRRSSCYSGTPSVFKIYFLFFESFIYLYSLFWLSIHLYHPPTIASPPTLLTSCLFYLIVLITSWAQLMLPFAWRGANQWGMGNLLTVSPKESNSSSVAITAKNSSSREGAAVTSLLPMLNFFQFFHG